MKIQVKKGDVVKEPAEVLVLGGYEDETQMDAWIDAVDRLLNGQLRTLRTTKEFQGKLNQTVLVHTPNKHRGPRRVLLVGLGKRGEVTLDRVRQAMGTAVKRVRQAGAQSLTVPLLGGNTASFEATDQAQAMVEGTILGNYRFTHYLTNADDQPKAVQVMTLLATDASQLPTLKRGALRGEISGEATAYVRDLCNHPANVMTPARIVEEAKLVAKEKGVRLTVLDRKQQEKLGMGGLLGVSRGSAEPAKFIVLTYSGAAKREPPVVLVGKTVTFDSGGISLKPAENMEQMKADMTGGAEVLATVRAAARLRLPLNLVGILPATENMPGGRAIKPGDILRMLSGKTVEVQNTDAEGRLVLADGLAYAVRLKPACILDVATLTGACMVALGQFAIGMLGNDDSLKAQVKAAGEQAGERVWEMPLWEEYFEQLKSDVADMRNIGGRGGGMITAAMFLSKFVENVPWVHLDIASTDWSQSERPYVGKGPTGIGARLLLQFLLNRTQGK
ncbi:MAG: leucyl aminopeptidase [Nitrospirae bacterium]|nr:MAG: leucyl aminopeptidase [Nitrospirota bacterium]